VSHALGSIWGDVIRRATNFTLTRAMGTVTRAPA
jgi:hypothetical protein